MPFVAPVTKLARTAETTAEIPGLVDEALHAAVEPPTGPAFVDFPLDQVFMEAEVDADAPASLPDPLRCPPRTATRSTARPSCCAARAARWSWRAPGLYWARGEQALVRLCEELSVPVFLNGLARGCVPADHPMFFSRARGTGLKGADVALVVGVPMDFRLGFGGSFGDDTQIVVVGSAPPERPHPREVAAELYGGVAATLDALREGAARRARPQRLDRRAARGREREARRRAGRADRRPRAAAPAARLPRAEPGARPRRGRDRRRRRLRVVRRPRDRDLRAGLLDGSRPLRLPRARAPATRWPPRSPTPTARSACCSATAPSASPGWSSTRFVRHGAAGRRRDGQQRHLGAREAPDGVPLRLLGGGRAPARVPLRRGGARARRARRAGASAPTSCGPRSSARSRRASRRS